MERAIGITVHTGWGACVVVGGSVRRPVIIDNRVVALLEDPERFCDHRAAEMPAGARVARVHRKLAALAAWQAMSH